MADSEKASLPPTTVQVEDSTNSGSSVYTKSKAEKKLVLKQDLLITTLLSGSFFFAYLVSAGAVVFGVGTVEPRLTRTTGPRRHRKRPHHGLPGDAGHRQPAVL